MSPIDSRSASGGTRRPSAEDCLVAWTELMEMGIELAVAGIVSCQGVSREEAFRRLGERFHDEVERDTPVVLRMALGRPHD